VNRNEEEQAKREEWVMIGHLNYDVDAEIVSSLFLSHNIPVVIQGRNHRRMLGFIGGYIQLRVLVPLAYKEQGISLLESYHTQRDDLDFDPPTEEEQQGERQWLLFSKTSKKMGIALFLSAFLGFGLASLSAGLWLSTIILAPLQLISYSQELSAQVAGLFSIPVETYQSGAQLYIPLIDLALSWIYLIYQANRSEKPSTPSL
jgi:hypothetical protein